MRIKKKKISLNYLNQIVCNSQISSQHFRIVQYYIVILVQGSSFKFLHFVRARKYVQLEDGMFNKSGGENRQNDVSTDGNREFI